MRDWDDGSKRERFDDWDLRGEPIPSNSGMWNTRRYPYTEQYANVRPMKGPPPVLNYSDGMIQDIREALAQYNEGDTNAYTTLRKIKEILGQ